MSPHQGPKRESKQAARGAASRKLPRVRPGISSNPANDFSALVVSIRSLHDKCAAAASRAVNVSLTLRNWFIGFFLREYEQEGRDRAKYGERLVDHLSETLAAQGVRDLAPRTLRQCRQFYLVYPRIWQTLSAKFLGDSLPATIRRTLSARSGDGATGKAAASPPPEDMDAPLDTVLNALSFSHLVELMALDDPLKRAFYEIECIRGNWPVRSLKRQIATLHFERSGLSKDKKKLAGMVRRGIESAEPKLAIRAPYIFEFLGLRAKDAVAESDLEAALVEHLRDFLLELGHGFCLEAQQKSILIGKTRGFVDLVFYHRSLKCHVLVELKVDDFKHEHLGQLNTYVEWYRRHMMGEGDNPPVGLLLCTDKDEALVEYATAAVGNRLFVSKYAVELPSKEDLAAFLRNQQQELREPA